MFKVFFMEDNCFMDIVDIFYNSELWNIIIKISKNGGYSPFRYNAS